MLVQASFAQDVDLEKAKAGKALFKANCASCHNPTEKRTGPALKGATTRWEEGASYKGIDGKEWLHRWVRNYEDPVSAGNPYAMQIVNFDPSAMSIFPTLTDEQIDDILYYADNSTVTDPTPPEPPKDTQTAESSKIVPYILGGLLAILLLALFAMSRVSNTITNLIAESKGEAIAPKIPFYKNPKIMTFLVILAVILVGFFTIQAMTGIGRQQGYQPSQPIKYSHKLHAGDLKIDCQYCHSTASIGKHANIPSANVCMNCHKVVQKGPKTGTEEIAKIYKAVDYNPETKIYGNNQKPIEWIRIHNLPDHVYFNHAQHVNAGKVECQTCHGPIQEMEVVYQYAPLSMGWCINCHRQTEVQFSQNDYYSDIYEKYHQAVKDGKMSKVTVADVGGTDCQKCHY